MSMKSITTPGIVKTADSSDGNKKSAVLYEKVEQWMRDSVVEIVNNLREAPLLVHVYAEESGGMTVLKTEKEVAEEKWPGLMERWEKRETQLPDGVIFVEKLEDGEEEEEEDAITRAWGIVVQGRGVDCGPVCYLLKTSRVGAGPGLGLCCTHFCLMKVQSFRETARSQFKNCWLSQGLWDWKRWRFDYLTHKPLVIKSDGLWCKWFIHLKSIMISQLYQEIVCSIFFLT